MAVLADIEVSRRRRDSRQSQNEHAVGGVARPVGLASEVRQADADRGYPKPNRE